jgi:hypothetical protein
VAQGRSMVKRGATRSPRASTFSGPEQARAPRRAQVESITRWRWLERLPARVERGQHAAHRLIADRRRRGQARARAAGGNSAAKRRHSGDWPPEPMTRAARACGRRGRGARPRRRAQTASGSTMRASGASSRPAVGHARRVLGVVAGVRRARRRGAHRPPRGRPRRARSARRPARAPASRRRPRPRSPASRACRPAPPAARSPPARPLRRRRSRRPAGRPSPITRAKVVCAEG